MKFVHDTGRICGNSCAAQYGFPTEEYPITGLAVNFEKPYEEKVGFTCITVPTDKGNIYLKFLSTYCSVPPDYNSIKNHKEGEIEHPDFEHYNVNQITSTSEYMIKPTPGCIGMLLAKGGPGIGSVYSDQLNACKEKLKGKILYESPFFFNKFYPDRKTAYLQFIIFQG